MYNVVVANLPIGPRYNGGAMTVWGILNALYDKNEKVITILICDYKTKNSTIYYSCIEELKKKKLQYKIIFFKDEKIFFLKKILYFFISLITGSPHYFFSPQYYLKSSIEGIIKKLTVKRIFCYHFDTLSACYRIKNKLILACLGDLVHEPRKYKRIILNGFTFRTKILNKLEKYISIKMTKTMLDNIKFCGYYAHHYSLFMKSFIENSEYIRTSIVPPRFTNTQRQNGIKKIILVGDLTGTVTIYSLIFLKKFLQKYYDKLPSDLKFNIFGYGQLDTDFQKYKNLYYKGVSENLPSEFDNRSCLLACNEIDLGIRVRIITALACGTLVLTHKSNVLGIPELKHGKNCIIFNNIDELYKIFNSLSDNKFNIDQIKKNALKTFHNYFHYKSAFDDLINKSNHPKLIT
jgi:hypothetical protein